MWIAIWACLAVVVFSFVGWTLLVLLQQKKAWREFAKKHDLKYETGKFMDAAVVTGNMNGRIFSLYSGVQQTDDVRGQRFVTVIEFQMGKGMPTGAAIATKEFAGFISGLIFDETYKPSLAEWKDEYVISARDKKNIKAWFSKEREEILNSLFAVENSAALFFFDEFEAVLRVETSDPLRSEAHLSKVVKRIMEAVEILAPSIEEKKKFKKLLAEEKKRQKEGDDEDEDDELEEVEKTKEKKSKPEEEKKKVQEDDVSDGE